MNTTSPAELTALLAPLRHEPEATALLCDVDGTLAPIVGDPADARVPESTREALRDAARWFAFVACVTGRPALEARYMVGVEELTYAGNHGLELLEPASGEVTLDASVTDAERAGEFVRGLPALELAEIGLRIEDKGPIQAIHWRGAKDDRAAEMRARELAGEAEAEGLVPRWGRKVVELRPPAEVDKGVASERLVRKSGARHALFAGDDLTDLDAFGALRRLAEEGTLEHAICIGVASDEAPERLWDESDAIVGGTEGFALALRKLVGAAS
ncbi:MAG TPA: trehalose-phosphatase [Solirubrobacterales bacterium]|nr:trehalose-phosphatase [Solirubrobacterales bacterium]